MSRYICQFQFAQFKVMRAVQGGPKTRPPDLFENHVYHPLCFPPFSENAST